MVLIDDIQLPSTLFFGLSWACLGSRSLGLPILTCREGICDTHHRAKRADTNIMSQPELPKLDYTSHVFAAMNTVGASS